MELRADERAAARRSAAPAPTRATPPSWATPPRATTPHFQPGPGNTMGYDDLKVIEAKKFLVAVTGGEQRNSTIEEALADAEVIAAAAASAVDGSGTRSRRSPAPPSARAHGGRGGSGAPAGGTGPMLTGRAARGAGRGAARGGRRRRRGRRRAGAARRAAGRRGGARPVRRRASRGAEGRLPRPARCAGGRAMVTALVVGRGGGAAGRRRRAGAGGGDAGRAGRAARPGRRRGRRAGAGGRAGGAGRGGGPGRAARGAAGGARGGGGRGRGRRGGARARRRGAPGAARGRRGLVSGLLRRIGRGARPEPPAGGRCVTSRRRWWSRSASSTRTWSVSSAALSVRGRPTPEDLAKAQGAIVRADAVVDDVPGPGPPAAGGGPHRRRGRAGRPGRRHRPRHRRRDHPGRRHPAVAEGAIAHGDAPGQAVRPADHAGPRGRMGRARGLRSATSPGRLGVVGYGRIGQRAGGPRRRAGHEVLAYDPVSEPPAEVRCADLAELVSRSDVITLHLPLLESTHHLVGAELAAPDVKPGAVLVNCGRGGLHRPRRRPTRRCSRRPARRGRAGRLRPRTAPAPPAVRPPRRRAHPAPDGAEPAGHRRHLHRRRPGSPRRAGRPPAGRGGQSRLGAGREPADHRREST